MDRLWEDIGKKNMGLDITAYRNIKEVPENEVNRDEFGDVDYSNVQVVVYKNILDSQNIHFPHRADELKGGECFTNDWRIDSISASRSYGSYNKWRDELYKISEDFYDLWEFPDNEGYFGASESEKLFQAFKKHYEKGKKSDLYCFFLEAFDYARQNGIVVFH